MITSINNELVKKTVKLQQKKYRDIENKFILEGFKCVNEAIDAGLDIEHIFILEKNEHVVSKFKNSIKEKVTIVNEHVLKKISTTDSIPEIVAVATKKNYSVQDLKNCKKLILLENIKDMGNLGTIFRSAKAFNCDGIILFGDECADVYNPKCVRSAVGNLWKIPFVYMNNSYNIKDLFYNYELIATLPKSDNHLKNLELSPPFIFMFGSEADGLSKELIKLSTKHVKIEMSDDVESLNLAVSCAVVLYEVFL